MGKRKYIKRSDSREPIRNFVLNKDHATVFPDFSFDTAMNAIDSDPVARGAFNHFVDKCMEGGYNIIKKDTNEVDEKEILRLQQKFKFRTEILRKIFTMLKLYNNCFIEIVRDTKGTKALNIIDSSNVEPITKPNGDPIKYRSKRPNPVTGDYIFWNKDELVWIKLGDRTKGFAPVDIKALYETLLSKEYVRRYVAWLWKTGQYRILYNFKNSTSQDVEDFLTYSRKVDESFQLPSISKGEMETKVLRDLKETDSIIGLLSYYDSQTLIALRVPPIDAGIPDASGRSNADAQSNNLATHVISIKKIVEDAINWDLFPKISKSANLLIFAPSDRFHEKQIFETVQIMQSMSMTPEAMKEYFNSKGMYWKSTLFNPLPDPADLMAGGNPRDKDTAPSRKGKGAGAAEKVIGSGEQSTTRSDQL